MQSYKKATWLALGGLGAIALLIAWQKLEALSAEPLTDKDCGPIPENHTATKEFGESSGTEQIAESADAYGKLDWSQRGGYINDASCLNRTPVYGIVTIDSEQDVADALAFARERDLPVSMAGVKHSMGGQAFARQVVVLDMKQFNQIQLNAEARTVRVQSGATWHDIQQIIHPRFAIQAMQSSDIFTVGGSISVNAHGMDHQAGSVGRSIRSMRVMLADGSVMEVSHDQNPELFKLVVGGYGLFGVILDVELAVVENHIYDFKEQVIPMADFPEHFAEHIQNQTAVGLFYGHLSTAPSSFLDEMIVYTYTAVNEHASTQAQETTSAFDSLPPLAEPSQVKLRRLILNLAKTGTIAQELKWWAEKNIEPHIVACTLSRNQAMTDGESCLVSRNEPMHDSVGYLRNNLPTQTDILQEYYVPQDQLSQFVAEVRHILNEHHMKVLNASVRVVHAEDNVLSYATDDRFALVLYINQPVTTEGSEQMKQVTQKLIDLSIDFGGTFFLPYQLHYAPEQLERAYPMISDFFAAKRQYDPDGRFTNTFYETYGKGDQ